MENDRCELEDVGERHEEGGRGDTEQTSSQRRSVRPRADCDVLTTQKTGHFPHSTVELTTNKCAINSERSAAGIRIIDQVQGKEKKNVETFCKGRKMGL